jgi:hypothetical protein
MPGRELAHHERTGELPTQRYAFRQPVEEIIQARIRWDLCAGLAGDLVNMGERVGQLLEYSRQLGKQ